MKRTNNFQSVRSEGGLQVERLRCSVAKKEYQRTVQELKRAIQQLDKAKGGTMIREESDVEVITAYKR